MKKTDITNRVMQKIVNYEKQKSIRWLKVFGVSLLALILFVLVTTGLTVKQMIDFQAFDMLSLFGEDREIIAQYWQDTLSTVWQELPQRIVFISFIAIIILIGLIFFTRAKRKIIKKKLSEVAKYQLKK